jgi:hypothetical protein
LHLQLPNASRLDQSDASLAKRPKLANDDQEHQTIASRLHHNLYLRLDDFEHDFDHAFDLLVEATKAKEQLKNGQRLPPQDIASLQRLSQFRTFVKTCLARERSKNQSMPIKKEEEDPSATKATKTVLSLFGNAPQPRQLFSSLQHSDTTINGAGISLEDFGLPNMISATQLVPLLPGDALASRKPVPTFADVFPPPASLPPLNPPKPIRHTSSKSSTISWSVGELPKASRKAGYTLQPLTVGTWVGYGAVEVKESVSAIKRRRRESLLGGQDQSKPVEESTPADIIAQESALFRAAYSSFAPTQDNSKAVVAKDTKNMVWWHRMGQKRFDKHFVLDPALQDSLFPIELVESAKTAAEQDAAAMATAEHLQDIQKVIDEFDEEAFKPAKLDVVSTINEEEREVEQMLVEISELLQALSSHQRIRSSFVPTGSRNPASPSPLLLSAMVGTSSVPSPEENETYRALRSQIAQLISKLPPYAVAKLDGKQFQGLAVKKDVIIQGKEYRGTMEEDQLTRLIRNTAAMQAAATAGAQKPESTPQYGRTPSVQSRSAHAPSNYYSTRTPVASYRGGAAQSYNAPATAPRAGYPNTYNTNGNRSSFSQSQFYQQRPTHYAPQYSTQTPQPANPARPGFNVPQTAFAPRTTASSFANGTSVNAAAATYTPQTFAPTRPMYASTSTPGVTPQTSYSPRPQSYAPAQQQPNSGRATPTFAQPQNPNTPSAVGPSGFHSTLTAEQQSLMMERQRAQLAMQPQARAAAQTASMGGGSAAPQAPMHATTQQPNGHV